MTAPLPFRDLHHVGVSVPDLDAAASWFADVLGARPITGWGPFADAHGSMLADLLQVDPRTSVRGLFLRLGPTTNVELVELSGTPRRDEFGGAADVGTAHLALFVEDLDAVLDAARDRPGIEWVGADAAMPADNPLAGYRFAFARAPWGLLLELISYPESLAAGRAAEVGMFTPPAVAAAPAPER